MQSNWKARVLQSSYIPPLVSMGHAWDNVDAVKLEGMQASGHPCLNQHSPTSEHEIRCDKPINLSVDSL
jgi:hypothetical protein